jgi:hypothetical protein
MLRTAAPAALAAAMLFAAAGSLHAADPAFDNASDPVYAPSFEAGDNGGTGFEPWVFETDQTGGAAGWFLAVGNPDLNGVGSGTGPDAWGSFANNAGNPDEGIQIAAAFRPFVGGGLEVGQTLKLSFEHGSILGGPLVAPLERTGGFVGFVLRDGFNGPVIDPISPFGSVNGLFAFGFRGGDTEYTVFDVVSPSGRATGVPFTDGGVNVEFERLSDTDFELRITPIASGTATTVPVTITTTNELALLGLYNRNAELNDAFFNNLEITPACAGDVTPSPRDGFVGTADLLALLAGWGTSDNTPYTNGDTDGDGTVGTADLLNLLADWGACG